MGVNFHTFIFHLELASRRPMSWLQETATLPVGFPSDVDLDPCLASFDFLYSSSFTDGDEDDLGFGPPVKPAAVVVSPPASSRASFEIEADADTEIVADSDTEVDDDEVVTEKKVPVPAPIQVEAESDVDCEFPPSAAMTLTELVNFIDTLLPTDAGLFDEEPAAPVTRRPKRKRVEVDLDRVAYHTKKIMRELNRATNFETVQSFYNVVTSTVLGSAGSHHLLPFFGAGVSGAPTRRGEDEGSSAGVSVVDPVAVSPYALPCDDSLLTMDGMHLSGEVVADTEGGALTLGTGDDTSFSFSKLLRSVMLSRVNEPQTKVSGVADGVTTASAVRVPRVNEGPPGFQSLAAEVNDRLYGRKRRKIDLIVRGCHQSIGFAWVDVKMVEQVARNAGYSRNTCASFRTMKMMTTSRHGRAPANKCDREPWGHFFPYWDLRSVEGRHELRLAPEFFGTAAAIPEP